MKPRVVIAIIASASIPVWAAVPASPEIVGRVIDENGRGIALALVIAQVSGVVSTMHSGGNRALYCTGVQTDPSGYFRVPAWKWSADRSLGIENLGTSIAAYHRNYIAERSVYQSIQRARVIGTPIKASGEVKVTMQSFTKNNKWREKLWVPLVTYRCDRDGDVRNEQLIWDQMHEEVEEYTRETSQPGVLSELRHNTRQPETERPKPVGVDIRIEAKPDYRSAPPQVK